MRMVSKRVLAPQFVPFDTEVPTTNNIDQEAVSMMKVLCDDVLSIETELVLTEQGRDELVRISLLRQLLMELLDR